MEIENLQFVWMRNVILIRMGLEVFVLQEITSHETKKMAREDAHPREAETCRKRPRETPGCAKAHSFYCCKTHVWI